MVIEKIELENDIIKFNDELSKYETDSYLSKQHLIDFIDTKLSEFVKKHKLNIEMSIREKLIWECEVRYKQCCTPKGKKRPHKECPYKKKNDGEFVWSCPRFHGGGH